MKNHMSKKVIPRSKIQPRLYQNKTDWNRKSHMSKKTTSLSRVQHCQTNTDKKRNNNMDRKRNNNMENNMRSKNVAKKTRHNI